MARQRLGQHFLADLDTREQIARAIGVSAHSIAGPRPTPESICWIEVGAGHGEMTEYLLATGAQVYSLELDPPLVAGLQRLAKRHANLRVIAGDVLQTDLAEIAAGRRIRLYGNLPYYITSPILQHCFAFAGLLDEIHVVIQLEVAQRLCAASGSRDYGYLSVLTQYFCRTDLALEIPRTAFAPPPEVDSALVSLRLPGERTRFTFDAAAESAFLNFVKLCFSQKRKTLVNNLRALAQPAAAREVLEGLQLRPDARAEQLSVSQLASLYANIAAGA